MAQESGYSGTPLAKKIGLRQGQRALLVAVPDHLIEITGFDGFGLCAVQPDLSAAMAADDPGPFDLIHVFERNRAALEAGLPGLRARLDPAGMIWVSWPKKAAKVPTTLTGNIVRELALGMELVDVKVCAVDAVWSGLKLMIPRALRPA
jgi:hypothetical protein